MPIYHYNDSSLINRVDVNTMEGSGAKYAMIFLLGDANSKQLEGLRQMLGANGLSTLMDTKDGHEVLQVRGIKDEKSLISSIEKSDLTQGSAAKEDVVTDHKKTSFTNKIRQNSLFLSAIFYDIGNAAFIVSGIQRGRHNKSGKLTPHDKSEIMIGAAFTAGDLLMTKYGHDTGDEELTAAANGLKQYLKDNDIQIPEGDALNPDSLHQSGAAQAVDKWLQKNITKVKAISEMAGGGFTMHAAMKPGEQNNGKLAAGAMLSSGWLATLLLDKPTGYEVFDGDKPPSSSIVEKAAENPRGWIARPLAIANNVANLWGAMAPHKGERARVQNEVLSAEQKLQQHRSSETLAHLAYTKAKQHDYAWNVVSAASFIVANSLFGLSDSGRPAETEDDKMMMGDLILMSANMLANQPEHIRKQAIEETSEYVSHLSHITLNKEELSEAIYDKMASLDHSKWSNRVASSNLKTDSIAQR